LISGSSLNKNESIFYIDEGKKRIWDDNLN
jgi:hypothetical protein